jgi:hypothetical protein
MLRLALNGLLPLSPSCRLGREAVTFCQERFLQRDVEFEVREVDRYGGFISDISAVGSSGQPIDVACSLLAEGLSELHHRTATTMKNYEKLQEIQDTARRDEVGKWADKSRFGAQLKFGEFYPVRIVAAWTACDVVVQFLSDVMQEIDVRIQTPTPQITRPLKKNDMVCVVHNKARYRARVEQLDEGINVRLVDFDLPLEVSMNDVFELPPKLDTFPPQAGTVHLAFLKLVRDVETERNWLFTEYKEYALYMHLMHSNQIPCVLLYDKAGLDGGTLNSVVLAKLSVRVVDLDFDFDDVYNGLLDSLKKIDQNLHKDDHFDTE